MSRRYTKDILVKLGYTTNFYDNFHTPSEPDIVSPADDMSQISTFGFDNVIKTIFTEDDKELPNLLSVALTDNTPQSVKDFVSAVLNTNITALKSAPDSSTAFDMILPRSAYDSSSFAKYAEHLRNTIGRYKKEFDDRNTPES